MIGFLCNSREVVNYYTCYYNSFKTIMEKSISMVFFTINRIDFKNRKLMGIVVSKNGIRSSEVQIPRVIFNFSNHCKRTNIKKFKLLCGMEEIEIINETNRFNQLMIMEILSSLDNTKKYILPYHKSSEKEIIVDHAAEHSFLVIPKLGSSFSRMIYIKQLQIYPGINTVHFPYYEEKGGEGKIVMPYNKSLIIVCPKLIVCESNLSMVRIYMQKGSNNTWKYLHSSTNLNKNIIEEGIMDDLKTISIKCINYINNYIPGIGICFMDFVFDKNMNPYFLHLGGWDKNLFKKGDKILHKEFCENLIQCYEYYVSESQEG